MRGAECHPRSLAAVAHSGAPVSKEQKFGQAPFEDAVIKIEERDVASYASISQSLSGKSRTWKRPQVRERLMINANLERNWHGRLQKAFARADKVFGSRGGNERTKAAALLVFSPRTSAIHEAGHGVVTYRLGGQVKIIEIGQRHNDRELTNSRSRIAWRASVSVEQIIIALLAGQIAHLRVDNSDAGLIFIRNDRNEINRLVLAACAVDGDHDIAREVEWRALMPDLIEHAAELVDKNWRSIESVADALLERTRLTSSQFVKALGPGNEKGPSRGR